MANAIFKVPTPINEPILEFRVSSPERADFIKTLSEMKSKEVNIPMIINGERVFTRTRVDLHPPYELSHKLGVYNKGTKTHVKQAIEAALGAKEAWETMPWQERAAIFLRAAELISGPYRSKMLAATMLAQSKNIYQAEIDCVAELADFLRYNAKYMTEIYAQQPESSKGIWNRLDYRPLEGFVFAITPFNFTAIAGNLPAAPALMGNTVVWKAAESQIYSAALVMDIFLEAGLPAGVINLIHVDGTVAGDVIFNHADFAGLHFTGSTGVFQHLWKTIGNNISKYKSYPRIVGETGGKDFVMVHPSSDPQQVITALSRGAFEFQGQKCSAASRAYIPNSMKKEVMDGLKRDLKSFKMGTPEDFGNFINSVIDEKSFNNISKYIDHAKKSKDAKIAIGGICDKSIGYFIEPTVIVAKDPKYKTMCEEVFGPVLSIHFYSDNKFEETLDILADTSPYALTGSIFSKDRAAVILAAKKLKHCAGNFYINDKPTGAVVGQQPFGGGRASGTNDKAGSLLNLYRWVSPQTIKENFNAPRDYRYPFLQSQQTSNLIPKDILN